jgi:hypothetical protein
MTYVDLGRRNHILGGGMINVEQKFFYLSIPKNASTFLSSVLHDNEWKFWNVNRGNFDKAIIVLRDPVERWISGFATYVAHYLLFDDYRSQSFIRDYNTLVERIVFDNLIFDDHTMPQSFFVNQLPDSIEKYFVWANKNNTIKNIETLTQTNLIVDPETFANSNDFFADTRDLVKFFQSHLDSNLIDKIKSVYQDDYNLIESVKIHEH